MKAVRLNKIGDFRMEEVPLPEVKGEELLVKVEACGICGSDLPGSTCSPYYHRT